MPPLPIALFARAPSAFAMGTTAFVIAWIDTLMVGPSQCRTPRSGVLPTGHRR